MEKVIKSAFQSHKQLAINDVATFIIRQLENFYIQVGEPADLTFKVLKDGTGTCTFTATQGEFSNSYVVSRNDFDALPDGIELGDVFAAIQKIWCRLKESPQYKLTNDLSALCLEKNIRLQLTFIPSAATELG